MIITSQILDSFVILSLKIDTLGCASVCRCVSDFRVSPWIASAYDRRRLLRAARAAPAALEFGVIGSPNRSPHNRLRRSGGERPDRLSRRRLTRDRQVDSPDQ